MSSHPANRYIGPLRDSFRSLAPAWQAALTSPDSLAALQRLASFLDDRVAAGATIFPRDPFYALSLTPPESVRVIILGQDPYHGPNQAQGLSFSVPDTCACPPSLRNIFKELARSHPGSHRRQGHDLSSWASQGVLLLNTVLTVEARQPASHANQGWEQVTDALIRYVAGLPQPKVFLLWGAHAQNKRPLLREVGGSQNHVLIANHPSPFSAERPPRPFIGCNHFIDANHWLVSQGQGAIDWLGTLEDTQVPNLRSAPMAPVRTADEGDLDRVDEASQKGPAADWVQGSLW